MDEQQRSGLPPLTMAAVRRYGWLPLTVLLIAVALGGPILDGLDELYPHREAVRRYADPELTVALDTDGSAVDEGVRREVADALASVPGFFVAVSHSANARVVITDQDLDTLTSKDSPLETVAGLYLPADNRIYVSQKTDRPGRTALHELGHLLDHRLGDLSGREDFRRLYERMTADQSVRRYYVKTAGELFAGFFAKYYYSDRARERLEADYPEAFAYFQQLEQHYLTGSVR